MQSVIDYLLGQADKPTAWIGVIGLILFLLGLHSLLAVLFIALIVLPEAQFSQIFQKWTKALRDKYKDAK